MEIVAEENMNIRASLYSRYLRPALFAVLVFTATLSQGQFLSPQPPGAVVGSQAHQPPQVLASEFRPNKIREQLLSYHGVSKEQLDAVSTNAATILTGFIRDTNEKIIVQRQAIKALKFYPTDEVFEFIKVHMQSAAPPMQQLYLIGLKVYAASKPTEVTELVRAMLQSQNEVTRHATVSLLGSTARHTPLARQALESSLQTEEHTSVRNAIEAALTEAQ